MTYLGLLALIICLATILWIFGYWACERWIADFALFIGVTSLLMFIMSFILVHKVCENEIKQGVLTWTCKKSVVAQYKQDKLSIESEQEFNRFKEHPEQFHFYIQDRWAAYRSSKINRKFVCKIETKKEEKKAESKTTSTPEPKKDKLVEEKKPVEKKQ